ncbi:DUF342 domain-containing protein [Allobacillus sp. GCM10007491]|uniref:DUF342 domain-containing protein n=2 Tax=Allobacillus TaxID=1400133 RepID=A0A941CTG8_9BACI|nr:MULTISPECIES: FapA family protein [Allobacillus]MBR7552914.1 DUF342 domain-containing protein [Allobacillus saliphilus]TSJ67175.1 DUF342 domain-containing protein [Allobacillus salarius]
MDLSNVFLIQISDDTMQAQIEFNREELQHRSAEELNELKAQIQLKDLVDFARSKSVTYGLLEDVLLTMIQNFRINQEPVVFAQGIAPQHGKNGVLKYHVQLGTSIEIHEQETIDFKEIMVIPKVEIGTKLVTIIPPSETIDGMSVTGKVVKAKPGKPAVLNAGKNTEFREEHQAIFATGSGQVSLIRNQIQVLPVYEVKKSVSMETGNIDFNGSIVINGDVPTGFSLKARGDITIHGTVEAASLEAGGSIFVHEGVYAFNEGILDAGMDIRVRNINQANLKAGRNIIIENSCLHSYIDAQEMLYCQRGHIIGGHISVGKKIEGNDFGNRLETKTEIYLGQSMNLMNLHNDLELKIEHAQDQLKKLKLLGERLEEVKQVRELSSKERVMLLRQRNSYNITQIQLQELLDKQAALLEEKESLEFFKMDVNGIIYPNVHVMVGKYSMSIQQEYKQVSVIYKHQDFSIIPL